MRRRLISSVLATCLAATMALAAPARPAKAVAWAVWVNVAVAVAGSLFSSGGGGGVTAAELERAKNEILHAINQSQQEILAHIDAIAAADVRACLRSGTILMPTIDYMDPYTLPVFMQNSLNCATTASAYFDAVVDLYAADHIAKVLGEIYSIAMVSFAKMGFDSSVLLDDLIASYQSVLNKVKPTCGHSWGLIWDPEFSNVYEHTYACRFANEVASWTEILHGSETVNPIDYAWVDAEPMKNTVRPHVLQILPQLQQIRTNV
jgi:hypothetical protein